MCHDSHQTLNSWDVEDANLIDPVIDGLTQLPQLEELCLRFQSPQSHNLRNFIFPLERFCHRSLCRISLTHASEVFGEDLTQQLSKIVKQNPLLTHLDFEFTDGTRLGNCTFHTLVRDIPKGSPLPLRHLRLRGCHLSFDNSTLSHLKFLSSIDISSSLDSNYDHLWLALANTATWLKEISVDKVSQNLLEYLTLYSGLTKFCYIDKYDQPCQKADVHRFFSIVLPMHQNLLSTLTISTHSPDFWCITPVYMTPILALQQIKSLTVTLAFDAISSGHFDGIPLLVSFLLQGTFRIELTLI